MKKLILLVILLVTIIVYDLRADEIEKTGRYNLVQIISGSQGWKSSKEYVNLFYCKHTKIIYILLENGYGGYMSAYISENGKYCRWINGKIVEVE